MTKYELIFLGKDPDSGREFISYEAEGTADQCMDVFQMYCDKADKFSFYETIKIALLKSNFSLTIIQISKQGLTSTFNWVY